MTSDIIITNQQRKGIINMDNMNLNGEYTDQYLHDMKICQEFADENRKMIARQILDTYGLEPLSEFATVHNYIDHDSNIIRKGAVSAQKGEKLLIPINMRDGSLLCVGKGNKDWNYSAPHGAGRLFSRSAAKYEFTVEEYAKTMKEAGIFNSNGIPFDITILL
jgi:RNA-splicing ligase RtcB